MTRLYLTERLLMGHKESNQTKQNGIHFKNDDVNKVGVSNNVRACSSWKRRRNVEVVEPMLNIDN